MQKRNAAKKGATGSAKKARSSGREEPACEDCKGNPVQQAEEEDTTNIFSLEMDTLQCDICYMPFESQVYMPFELVEKLETEYKMVVKGDEPGALSLTASVTVQFVRKLEGYKAKGFLFVPDDFWGSSNSVTVTVHL